MTTVLRILVYSYFIVFPFGLLLRLQFPSNIAVTALDFIIIAIFVTLLTNFSLVKRLIFGVNFLKLQALFILIGVLSLFLNYMQFNDINFITSFLYAVRYTASLSLVCIGYLLRDKFNIRKPVLMSGSIFVLFGFIQYLLFYDLRPYTNLGWDDHLYRLFSTFFDPNFSGLFYCFFFLYLLRDIFPRKFFESYKEIFISFFTAVSVYATYSRTALLSFVAGIISVFLLMGKGRSALIISAGLIFSLFLFSDTKIEGLNPLRTVSAGNRIASFVEAIGISNRHPILGVGFNAYRYAQLRYETREEKGALISNADAGTDNSFLFVLVTTGILGFAVYLLSYAFLVLSFIRSKNIFFLSILIAFFVGGLFVNVLFYVPIMSWLFLLIGFEKGAVKADK